MAQPDREILSYQSLQAHILQLQGDVDEVYRWEGGCLVRPKHLATSFLHHLFLFVPSGDLGLRFSFTTSQQRILLHHTLNTSERPIEWGDE
jgi:hypothetical protein